LNLINVYSDYETAWIRRGRLRPVPHPPVHCRLQDAQRKKEEECRAVLNNSCFIFNSFFKDTRPSIRHRYLILFPFPLSMLFLGFLRRINTADHFLKHRENAFLALSVSRDSCKFPWNWLRNIAFEIIFS
jgi:hypothetical protein